jgi:hypothetical protein
MLTKLMIGAALILTAGLSGGAWAIANKKADDCRSPGSDWCFPASLWCSDWCVPSSPSCYPGSPYNEDGC